MVLLRNDDNVLPLKDNARKVTLLGYSGWHNNMSGDEDPATTYGAVSLYKGIEDDADLKVDPNVTDGTFGVLVETEVESSGEMKTQTSYTDYGAPYIVPSLDQYKSSCAEYNTAIVTLKRNSGEGNDQVTNVASSTVANDAGESYSEDEFNRTGLSLTVREMALIDYANKNFDTVIVIVIVNSANTMELGSYADTTWFLEYEEDICIGYRYHETAAKEAEKGNYDGYSYDREVVYPFGYGLSCTTFSREYDDTPTYDSATETYHIQKGDNASFLLRLQDGYETMACSYPDYTAVPDDSGFTRLELHHVVYPTRVRLTCQIPSSVITFEPNGGYFASDGSREAVRRVCSQSAHLRFNTLSGGEKLLREGYVHTGWNTEPDGSGQHIGLGSRVAVEKNGTLCLHLHADVIALRVAVVRVYTNASSACRESLRSL